jgi:RNA polymerase sigma-70 factor (ECF subfamily)
MVDHIRKSHRDKIVPFDETYEAGEIDSEIEKLTDDTERQVYDIMSHLKQDERELLSMRYKLNMDYNQIAAVTGISPKAAAKRVERILKKCRDYVAL